jgi:trimethylamine:corrinoid methyltransferase-like protein
MVREKWEQEGRKDLKDIIDQDLRHILATHQPEPLAASVLEQCNSIVRKYGRGVVSTALG